MNTASTLEVVYEVDLAGKFSGRKVFVEELEKAVPHFYKRGVFCYASLFCYACPCDLVASAKTAFPAWWPAGGPWSPTGAD